MTETTELRAYMEIMFAGITKELQRLSLVIENTDKLIRNIELKTSNDIIGLRKDMDNAFEKIRGIENEVEKQILREMEVRQAADMAIENKVMHFKDDQAKRWETEEQHWAEQGIVNATIKALVKLLWAIATILFGLLITYVWDMIVSGAVP